MKIKFIGALGTVTGSCTLLKHRGRYYLIDCGATTGAAAQPNVGNHSFPFNPKRLAGVFLTHAHLDHCGLLLQLARAGFNGLIYCTRATADLTTLALKDAVTFNNGAFSSDDAYRLRFSCPDEREDFQFGKFFALAPNLTGAFIRTSHVLGSVAVEFQFSTGTGDPRRTIVFSGDIGCNTDGTPYQMLLNGQQHPSTHAEFLVLESTYGDRRREAGFCRFEQRMSALKKLILDAVAQSEGATIVLPAFSLQRTQELIVDLHCVLEFWIMDSEVREALARGGKMAGRLADILVDSPLATQYGAIFARELYRMRSDGKPFYLNPKIYSWLRVDRQQLEVLLPALLCGKPFGVMPRNYTLQHGETAQPKGAAVRIIIAGAGMCNGGRVTGHLKRLLTTNKTIVAITGFQGSGTPGAELFRRVQNPSAIIDGRFWDLTSAVIKATVVSISQYYSGHADQAGLLDFALHKNSKRSYEKLKRIFLVHGDESARRALKDEIEARAAKGNDTDRKVLAVELPNAGSGWFDLAHNRWVNDYDHSSVETTGSAWAETESVLSGLEMASLTART